MSTANLSNGLGFLVDDLNNQSEMCQYIRIIPQFCNHHLGFESYMDNLIVWSWVSHSWL